MSECGCSVRIEQTNTTIRCMSMALDLGCCGKGGPCQCNPKEAAGGKRPPCPRCAEWDAVPVGNGPKRSAALKAMGRSFAVHTCGLEAR